MNLFKTTAIITLAILSLSAPARAGSINSHLPATIDTGGRYLFYLHGRIIEVQGKRPVSPRFGVYEYEKILRTFADSGFTVISEARPADTRPAPYAQKVVAQIDSLLTAGVPARHISVIGASKGAGISVLISNTLKNPDINFVLLAICNRGMAAFWKKNHIQLWGRVLYLYDRADTIAGSCRDYMPFLKSPGLSAFKEIKTELDLGHGLLFRPIKAWVSPALNWIRGE